MLKFGTMAFGGKNGGEHELVKIGVIESERDIGFATRGEVFSRGEEMFKLLEAFCGEGGEEFFLSGEVFVGGIWADVDSSGYFAQ